MDNTFLYGNHRVPKNEAAEVDRLMPAGARRCMHEIIPGEDLTHLPMVILEWMLRNKLIRRSESKKNRGSLVLSPLGQQVRSMNIRKMEGKND